MNVTELSGLPELTMLHTKRETCHTACLSSVKLIPGILFLIFCFSSDILHAQQYRGSSLRSKLVFLRGCILELDSVTLVPGSVRLIMGRDTIMNIPVSNRHIQLSPDVCDRFMNQTVQLQYRVFPFDVGTIVSLQGSDSLRRQAAESPGSFEYRPAQSFPDLVESKRLESRGSFSRGFSVGNRQSLVLNSNFDMQLRGDLGNGLEIAAAISDENLPVQAQGNTQQLQEFDKVFIQISRGDHRVQAGDYELAGSLGHFVRYFKKLEGISASTVVRSGTEKTITARGSYAVSRGKFARRFLAINEGNQGPYRLTGNFNERFIIVLSGTEKVFFNGILLQRGFDLDYVIDYNRAEITFSPTRPIGRDSRVIVEFEYTDISYLRTLTAADTEFKGRNWVAGFGMYSEQDSRQGTGAVSLDSVDLLILRNSGDNPGLAVRKSIRTVSLQDRQTSTGILYGGKPDPLQPEEIILYYTENPDSASYQASFTEVGPGKGDYVLDGSRLKNGRVYSYAGKGKGTYLPVIQLIPPEQRQMATAYLRMTPVKGMEVEGEVSASQYDKNRLSDANNDDNLGLGSYFRLRQEISIDSSGKQKWFGEIRNEVISRDFTALNPFRSAEFTRDWNISLLNEREHEQWWQLSTGYKQGDDVLLDYGIQFFQRRRLYSGVKHSGNLSVAGKRWNVRATGHFLSSTSAFLQQATQFYRPNIRATYYFTTDKSFQATFEWDAESNLISGMTTDTLARRSASYDYFRWFAGTDFEKSVAIRAGFSRRTDAFGKAGLMTRGSEAYEWELAGKWATTASDLQWSFIARDLRVLDRELLPQDKSRRTVLGKLDHSLTLFRQAVKATTSYNATSGQEPRYEYVFQRVETGQGEYVYIGDSTAAYKVNVQDFRFDPSNPLASYIRLSLPNNELIRTSNTELNQTTSIDMSRIFIQRENQPVWQVFLSRFSLLSTVRALRKVRDGRSFSGLALLPLYREDTSLVAYQAQSNQTLFINKGHQVFDAQVGRRATYNVAVFLAGPENRRASDWFFRSRWGISSNADIILTAETGVKKLNLTARPERNLDIRMFLVRPEFTYRPTLSTRLNIKYTFQHKQQQTGTLDEAVFSDVSLELAYRKSSEASIDAGVSVVGIRFTGIPDSFIEYDLLEGLKNGRNYLWHQSVTRRLTKSLECVVRYEGRKTANLPVVHVGRIQLKATF